MLKVSIFAAVQLFVGGTLTWHLSASRHAGAEDRAERIQALSTMAPMFTLLSIGISAYYFGKDLLFVLEVQALRPAQRPGSQTLKAFTRCMQQALDDIGMLGLTPS